MSRLKTKKTNVSLGILKKDLNEIEAVAKELSTHPADCEQQTSDLGFDHD